jgi:hypothetical protein
MINTQRFLSIEFNTSAKVITALFVFYVGILTFSLYEYGALFTVTTPSAPFAGALASLAGGFAGFNSARLFGGRRNFTGRLLMFYSVALVLGAFSWLLWGISVRGEVPSPSSGVESLFAGTIIGHALAGVALLISAKALVSKVTRREVALVSGALVFSLSLSLVTGFYLTSLIARIVWSGIWPITIFLQLACGLVLVSLLGKWYMAKQLAYITFAYLSFSIMTPVVIMIGLAFSSFSSAEGWLTLFIVAAVTNYIVGLAMTQVRPMKQDILSSFRNGNLKTDLSRIARLKASSATTKFAVTHRLRVFDSQARKERHEPMG